MRTESISDAVDTSPGPYLEIWSGGGTRMEASKAPTGVDSRKILACSPSKWCILMHFGARFRKNIIATMMFMTSAEV